MPQSTDQINSDPIVFLSEMAKQHRPQLAVPASGTREEYLRWSDDVKQKLRDVLGLDFMQTTPHRTSLIETKVEEGITRQRFCLETEPGYWAPVIVNVPEGKGPFPVMLCPHGHTSNGKEGVSGLISSVPDMEPQDLRKELDRYKDTYAFDLARKGFLTVSLDNRGFNQAKRQQPYTHNYYDWHLSELAWHNAFGRSMVGSMVWDAQQVLDHVLRRDDADADNVGCIGFSLGGTLSLCLSLLDPRIGVTVISGYFDSYIDRIARTYADCLCNYIPGLYAWFDIPDLTAALIPRPVLCNNEVFISKRNDDSVEQTRAHYHQTFEKVRQAYDAVGASERCELFMWESVCHTFNGERAYLWLEQYFSAGP